MSSLVLSPPEWKAAKKHYRICFSWDPTVDTTVLSDTVLDSNISEPLLNDESAKKLVDTILATLLEQGKRWFTKPLQESVVRNRLRHELQRDISGATFPDPPFQIEWIPTEILISSNQFVILWAVKGFKEMKTQIPSSFLFEDEESGDQLKEVDVEQVVSQVGGEALTLTESEEKRRSKEKVKAARVRAAIAKYKAEVLAQEYRETYGDLSDSSDEEEEDEEFGEDDE